MWGWKICTFTYSTGEHTPYPLISASHPSFLRQSTSTPLTMLLLSYLSQVQKTQDGVLVAKYVGIENMYLHLLHYSTSPTPLDLCLTSILSSPEHSRTPHHAIVVVPFASTEDTGWHTCSKVCGARKSVPSLFLLVNTPHTP